MAGHHDLGYKHLFAHPELVRELIGEFTAFSWLGAFDLAAFERVNPSYVSERFSERHDDLVWRHEVSPQSRLPPVLPLVFYNGEAPWSADLSLSDMIISAPPGLAEFQAGQRYCLIDEQRLDLAHKSSLLATLFRLELSESASVLLDVLPALLAWLTAAEQTPLRHAVTLWVERLFKREYPAGAGSESLTVREVIDMGARKFATWEDEAKHRGRQEGLAEGRAAGLRNALKIVIELRFGPLSDALSLKIEQIPAGNIDEWIARAMKAESLASLFDSGTPAGGAPLPP